VPLQLLLSQTTVRPWAKSAILDCLVIISSVSSSSNSSNLPLVHQCLGSSEWEFCRETRLYRRHTMPVPSFHQLAEYSRRRSNIHQSLYFCYNTLQIKPLPLIYMHTGMDCCTLTKWTWWNLAFPAVISASSTLIKYPHCYNVFGSTSVEYDAETKGVVNLQLIWSQLCFHTTFCILITWIWEHIFQNHETIVGHVFASILYESAQS